MSDPSPKPPLDYESSGSQFAGNTFWLVGMIFFWSILTALGVTVGVFGGATLISGNAGSVVGGLIVLAALATLGVFGAKRGRNPRRRAAALTGTLIGVAIGALVSGACFASLSNL